MKEKNWSAGVQTEEYKSVKKSTSITPSSCEKQMVPFKSLWYNLQQTLFKIYFHKLIGKNRIQPTICSKSIKAW